MLDQIAYLQPGYHAVRLRAARRVVQVFVPAEDVDDVTFMVVRAIEEQERLSMALALRLQAANDDRRLDRGG